jgi:ubiquinone/menaquinone biosynthesis C-methylase UbiE/uncharacterized protein YbaR (Trm112 family)
MKLHEAVPYACPSDKTPLRIVEPILEKGELTGGYLENNKGDRYPIHDGIVEFIRDAELPKGDALAVDEYDKAAEVYDQCLPITFDTVCEDEMSGRRKMISLLRLSPGSTVLEVGCGTGRDTVLIAEYLDSTSRLFAQDISAGMLRKCKEKLSRTGLQVEFARANACCIPLPDHCCDAVFHFGGFNTFSDQSGSFREMCRVTREGGRVVVGDEGIAPWMRSTLIGRVLMHNNPLYAHEPPLACIPEAARNVAVEWIFAGTFYVISFDVSKKELEINLDIPIPGKRGGTNRTRYFGKLEGVRLETKNLAQAACTATGKSMHDWLDAVVREAAERDLVRKPKAVA